MRALIVSLLLSMPVNTLVQSCGEPKPIYMQTSTASESSYAIDSTGQLTYWGDGAEFPPDGQYTYVGAGLLHQCAIRTDNTLTCWGDDTWGQVSTNPTGEFGQLSVGYYSNCALTVDGNAVCWGFNASSQASPPTDVLFSSVSVGYTTSCGITLDALNYETLQA